MNENLEYFRAVLLPRLEAAYVWDPPADVYFTVYCTRWPDQRGRAHAMLTLSGVSPVSIELGEVPASAIPDALQGAADAMLAKRYRKGLRAVGGPDVY